MKLICLECENEVDLSQYEKIKVGTKVECNHCGTILEITAINKESGELSQEIVDDVK